MLIQNPASNLNVTLSPALVAGYHPIVDGQKRARDGQQSADIAPESPNCGKKAKTYLDKQWK